jgi:hypothetical protein
MSSIDDLASLISGPPGGAAQNVRYRQGVVVSFDQNTLANVINVAGTLLTNLPLLGLGEATTYQTNDVVGILVIGDENSALSYAIIGQIVTPNTPEAIAAVSLLNQQIFSSQIITNESTTSTTYTDLATQGPQVTVNIGPTGRILVLLSVQIFRSEGAQNVWAFEARATIEMSGANVVAASDTGPVLCEMADSGSLSGGITNAPLGAKTITSQGVISGLTPGLTTIMAKYKSLNVVDAMEFSRRTLTVIRL